MLLLPLVPFFLIGNTSHSCQRVLGKRRWQSTGSGFKGYLMSGQIFPCSSGEQSKAWVWSVEAISLSWHTRTRVTYSSAYVLFQPLSSPFPGFSLALLKICIHSWSLYSAEVLKPVFWQGLEGTKRHHCPSTPRPPAPLLGAQDPSSAPPGAINPCPGDTAGVSCPIPCFSWIAVWLSSTDFGPDLSPCRCQAVNRMCHHPYICLPSPGAEGWHPIAAVTGATRCLCWGHCWPPAPLCLQSIPTPAAPQHALQSQLPAQPLPTKAAQ